ncbi:MAG: hypothetical protein ACYDC1_17815 [Limisphaerales bacterium]
MLVERGAVAVDGIADAAAARGDLHIRDDPIENVGAGGGHGDAQKLIRHADTSGQRTDRRGPMHQVGALLDDILRVHAADRQVQLRVQIHRALLCGASEVQSDLIVPWSGWAEGKQRRQGKGRGRA